MLSSMEWRGGGGSSDLKIPPSLNAALQTQGMLRSTNGTGEACQNVL